MYGHTRPNLLSQGIAENCRGATVNKEQGGLLYWVQQHGHTMDFKNLPTAEELIDRMFDKVPEKTEQELLRENIDREWKW